MYKRQVLNSYSGDELVYSKTLGDWRTHNGVDYAASRGAEVTASAEMCIRDRIVPKLIKGELDMAAIPANLAATLYQKTNGGIRCV